MKNSLVFILFLSFNCAFSQTNDTFSDGNFTANPLWQGETAAFTINSSKQLQTSLKTISQTVSLATANTLATNVKWEFFVKMDFNPSTTNRLRVYLISDNPDLKAPLNGYFIQLGETGNADSYDLFRQNGNIVTKIIDGAAKPRTAIAQLIANIQVTRTLAGVWELKTDNTGGTNYVSEGTVTDNNFINTLWFGVQCKYSATRSDKFYFDDLKIEPLIVDKTAPNLLSATAIDTATVEATFDEPMDSISAKISANYSLTNTSGNSLAITTTSNPNRYLLHFNGSLNTGSYILTVHGLKDQSGNMIGGNNIASFNYIKPYLSTPNDVVINEIFADPSPQVDLPTVEFIELWNTTDKVIALKNWTYSDAGTNFTFLKDSLLANEYLILCAKSDTNEFKQYGRVLGISPWPSLNNSGDRLRLKNERGTLISQANYLDTWYKDAAKKSGGWSFELIDPKSVCSGIQNWSSSKNVSGGTPGKRNSIFQSNAAVEPLTLLSASLTDSITILLTFNRSVDSLSAAKATNYTINNSVGNPTTAKPISPNFEQVILKLTSQLIRGNTFNVSASNVTDCAGTVISSSRNSAEFIYSKMIAKGDILINEILFNPRPDGVDFVEIYNNSESTLDLKDLFLATIVKDTVSSLKQISTNQLLLHAGEYLALSINIDNIRQEYHPKNPNAFLKMASLPGFNDDEGTVVLVSNNLRIDQLNYSDKMHFKLIKETEGVSLERSSFNLPTNDPGNFRSATASVGYATPGYENSQHSDDSIIEKVFSITSKTFSPDNDGFEDQLQINYRFAKTGLVGNVTIYNDQGVLIRKLIRNQTIESEGSFNWDGFNEFNELAPVGIYMVYAEFFDLNGQVKKYRKTCALAAKFN